jgi:hypothetical protein
VLLVASAILLALIAFSVFSWEPGAFVYHNFLVTSAYPLCFIPSYISTIQ